MFLETHWAAVHENPYRFISFPVACCSVSKNKIKHETQEQTKQPTTDETNTVPTTPCVYDSMCLYEMHVLESLEKK